MQWRFPLGVGLKKKFTNNKLFVPVHLFIYLFIQQRHRTDKFEGQNYRYIISYHKILLSNVGNKYLNK